MQSSGVATRNWKLLGLIIFHVYVIHDDRQEVKVSFHIGCVLSGTVMLEHVLKLCEKDGNYDSVFL